MPQIADEARAMEVLLELIPVAACVAYIGDEGELHSNAATRRLLGRDVSSGELPLKKAMASSSPLDKIPLSLSRSDGASVMLTATLARFPTAGEEPLGVIAIFAEPEAEARAEQFRELALALAEAEARERKRLAQFLHDDFQQLISAAKLKAGIVRRWASEDRIRDGAEQIENLLETAITASRSLTTELSPPVLYDAGLCAAIEAMVRSLEKQKGLKITAQCDERAEPAAEQVRVLLFESVRELLHNVVRHSSATAATIHTAVRLKKGVEITVIDNGHGFDPAKLQDTTARANRPFGLMEIHERLRWLGGGLEIDSQVGRGSRMRVYVPTALRSPQRVDTADHHDVAAISSIMESSPKSAGATHATRILVADDHAMFREGIISLLRHEPAFEVIGEAADGQQAIDLARTLKPDILLVDVTMPKLNGVQVTAQLSRELPSMRIVGLSMHERQDMAAAMRTAGAAAYVTKGGSSEMLLNVLRDLVKN